MKKFINILETLPEWAFLLIYLGLIFVYTSLLGLQGIGMQDEGWVLTAYQQIFKNPESVSYNFLYYNSILLGGIWELLFGEYGIIAFRLLSAIIGTLTSYIVYKTLRKYINRCIIVVGSFVIIFCTSWFSSFSHNTLSALLALLVIYFILRSIETKKLWIMLIAGVIAGINIFTRIPNIVQLSFILVLIPYYYKTRDAKFTFRLLVYAIMGCVIGVLFESVLMVCLGHFDTFINNIASGMAAATEGDSTHNISTLLKNYGEQLFNILMYCGVFCIVPVYVAFGKQSTYQKYFKYIITILCVLLYYYRREDYCEIIIAIYFIAFGCACLLDNEDGLTYAYVLSGIMVFSLPFGSDWGFNSGITLAAGTLAMPLSVHVCYRLFKGSAFDRATISTSLGIMMLVLSVGGIYKTSLTTGEESGSRLKKVYKINSPLASCIYTKKACADELNNLLEHLNEYVAPGDKLLCFQSLAMIHYLTQTQPYLGNAWPWTYSAADMEQHFNIAQKLYSLPIIVREKSWVASGWMIPYENWDNSTAQENRFHSNKKILLIQNFIRDNSYEVVWENELFQILAPGR